MTFDEEWLEENSNNIQEPEEGGIIEQLNKYFDDVYGVEK